MVADAVRAAILVIRHNALLPTAWASSDYPKEMSSSIFDPSFAVPGIEGLRPIAARLGWSERDTREACELIVENVMSFLEIPPLETQADAELRLWSVFESETIYASTMPANWAKLIFSDMTRRALSLQGDGAAIGCRLLKEEVSHDSRG